MQELYLYSAVTYTPITLLIRYETIRSCGWDSERIPPSKAKGTLASWADRPVLFDHATVLEVRPSDETILLPYTHIVWRLQGPDGERLWRCVRIRVAAAAGLEKMRWDKYVTGLVRILKRSGPPYNLWNARSEYSFSKLCETHVWTYWLHPVTQQGAVVENNLCAVTVVSLC